MSTGIASSVATKAVLRVHFRRRGLVRDTGPWREFLPRVFPDYFTSFGEHHGKLWDWVWSIERGVQPRPFVAIWPRGHGKSTTAEAATVALGARGVRSFVLYVSATQDQADTHVQNIAVMLESSALAREYPQMSRPLLSKLGHSRGWRRNRLRTASGLNIDAIGLDTAARGVKLDEYRPDVIICDDLDVETDTKEATEKKIKRLTQAILPAGSDDVAVLMIQNMVIPDGIFARLAEPPGSSETAAQFLIEREVSGPVPAVEGLEYVEGEDGRTTITGGRATWDGMDLDACQDEIDTVGISAFLIECQHQVRQRGGVVFRPEWWDGRARFHFHTHQARDVAARFQFWDTAESLGSTAAYTVCSTIDLLHNDTIRLVDVHRERYEMPDLVAAIERQAVLFNREGLLERAYSAIVLEYASSGRGAYQTILRYAPEWIAERIQPFIPQGTKEARAISAAVWARAGLVELPHPSMDVPWLHEFLAELFTFPRSRYADQVDSFSMGINYLDNFLSDALNARGRANVLD